jgi:hypothetical protein
MKLPYIIRVKIRNVIDFWIFPIIVGALWGILLFIITKSVTINNVQFNQKMENIAQNLIEKIQTK